MSVNVDGETEKAVDSIIERLLAVNIMPSQNTDTAIYWWGGNNLWDVSR